MSRLLAVLVLVGCGGHDKPPVEGGSCADLWTGPGGDGYVTSCTTAENKTYWCCNEGAKLQVCAGKDALTWHYLKDGCD